MITITLDTFVLIVAAVSFSGMLFGVISGIWFAKNEYSVYTRKFKEGLEKKQTEYENKIQELQKKDKETLEKFQNAIKDSMNEAILNKVPVPTPERFN